MHTKSVLGRDDLLTVIAIATLAACTSDVAHEAIGHGSACLLSGQRISLLNNAFFHCSSFGRYTAVAGPLGNLTAGLIAFAAQATISVRRPALRLYALLVMAFSLFWEAGYLIQAMIKDRGDSVFAYRELIGPETVTVRAVVVVIGVMGYFLFAHMLRLRSAAFANAPGRLRLLLPASWTTGVAAMALAASLYSPDRFGAAHDAGLSIVASFPLLFVGAPTQPRSEAAAPIVRSAGIIALGFTVFVAFALTMGRGIAF
ncbi:MAG TPA: hypothetical protein VIY90_12635 [Steroidobacteraceae bacterium]